MSQRWPKLKIVVSNRCPLNFEPRQPKLPLGWSVSPAGSQLRLHLDRIHQLSPAHLAVVEQVVRLVLLEIEMTG